MASNLPYEGVNGTYTEKTQWILVDIRRPWTGEVGPANATKTQGYRSSQPLSSVHAQRKPTIMEIDHQ